MKTIRRISKNPLLLLSLSIVTLCFSCGKEVPAITKWSGRDMMKGIYFIDGPIANYVTPMNELRLNQLITDEEQLQLIRNNIEDLLDQIEMTNPGTFQSFKNEMTSGDHIRIGDALTKYASIVHDMTLERFDEHHLIISEVEAEGEPLAKVIDSYFPKDNRNNLTPSDVKDVVISEDFNNAVSNYFTDLNDKIGQNQKAQDQMVLIVWFAAVAVVVIYVAAVLAYAAIYAWREIDWGSLPFERKILLKEQVIDAVATNFVQFK